VLGKMLSPTAAGPDETEVPYLKALHVQWDQICLDDLPTMWAAPWEIEQLALHVGDLLVCEGGEVGRAALLRTQPPDKYIIQNALHRVRGKEIGDLGFLAYCLKQAAEKGWFEVLCNRATISHFTVEKFSDLWLNLPSAEEQRRIAAFLDRETAQIDNLVKEKNDFST
jgi:type I restriction enzyme S subunit